MGPLFSLLMGAIGAAISPVIQDVLRKRKEKRETAAGDALAEMVRGERSRAGRPSAYPFVRDKRPTGGFIPLDVPGFWAMPPPLNAPVGLVPDVAMFPPTPGIVAREEGVGVGPSAPRDAVSDNPLAVSVGGGAPSALEAFGADVSYYAPVYAAAVYEDGTDVGGGAEVGPREWTPNVSAPPVWDTPTPSSDPANDPAGVVVMPLGGNAGVRNPIPPTGSTR